MTFQEIYDNAPTHIQDKFMALATMRERPDYHPEPSAKHHIEIVVNRAIEFGDVDIIMAAFYHDIHKVDTMKINEKTGWPTSPGHDKWAQKTIERDSTVRDHIESHLADPETVGIICGQHMRMHQMSIMRKSKQDALIDLSCFDKLSVFACFDDMMVTDEQAQENAQFILSKVSDSEFMRSVGKQGNKKR